MVIIRSSDMAGEDQVVSPPCSRTLEKRVIPDFTNARCAFCVGRGFA